MNKKKENNTTNNNLLSTIQYLLLRAQWVSGYICYIHNDHENETHTLLTENKLLSYLILLRKSTRTRRNTTSPHWNVYDM